MSIDKEGYVLKATNLCGCKTNFTSFGDEKKSGLVRIILFLFAGVLGVDRLRVRRGKGRLRPEGLRRHQLPGQVSHGEEAAPATFHPRAVLDDQPQEGGVPVRVRTHHRLMLIVRDFRLH